MRAVARNLIREYGGKVLTKEEVLRTIETIGGVRNPISYLKYATSGSRYLVRILRGLYYVKEPDEALFNILKDKHRIIALGLERTDLNWYFGLFTAMELGGYTHVHRPIIYVVNDKIHRRLVVAGTPVRLIKVKPSLIFGFNEKRISDPEKTLLDFLYLARYGTILPLTARAAIDEISRYLDKERLRAYARHYPEFVVKKLEHIIG